MRDLTVEQSKILVLVSMPNTHLSPTGSHLHHFMKPLIYTEDDQPNMFITSIVCKVTFASYNLHCHCNMHMSWDCRQSPLEALLNTLGMHHKTHTMTTRHKCQDTEAIHATQNSAPLDCVPLEHPMPEETMNHLINIVKKLTLTIPWLNYLNRSGNLKTNLQAWNLPLPNLHPQQKWCSSHINCST